jgi:cytochrome c-type biogenesis protein CcmH/NrfF
MNLGGYSMKPLLAIFLPWAYFFVQKRPVAGVVHLILWMISIPLLFVVVGFFIWGLQVTHAFWDMRKQLMDEQATAIATKMAAAMRPTDTPPASS